MRKTSYWGSSKQTQDTQMPYHDPSTNDAMDTKEARTDIPKPPATDVFTASVEEVEADLMLSFRQSATFRLYEPSDTLNKKTQIHFRHKYVSTQLTL